MTYNRYFIIISVCLQPLSLVMCYWLLVKGCAPGGTRPRLHYASSRVMGLGTDSRVPSDGAPPTGGSVVRVPRVGKAVCPLGYTKNNCIFCAPGGIRTPNRLLRRQLLYPIELRVHCFKFSVRIVYNGNQQKTRFVKEIQALCCHSEWSGTPWSRGICRITSDPSPPAGGSG